MTEDQSKRNRAFLILNATAFLCVAAGWILFASLGRQIVKAMYGSRWVEFLHKILMVEGQQILPLEHYLRTAEELMWSATLTALLSCFVVTLIVRNPSRRMLAVLGSAFLIISLSASGIAFLYPLEIETRESTVWLHVLALKQGVNLYDHTQVAYINTNHGPFDPIFKLFTAGVFPFLEAWHVTRISVLLLPFVFLIVAWRVLAGSSLRSLWHAVYLGSIGYLLLMVSAKDFIFVGRSDATAGLLLLALIYLTISYAPGRAWTPLLYGFLWGSVGILVILTNWRMLPVVFALLLFNLWLLWSKKQANIRTIAVYLTSSLCASALIFGLLLYQSFDFDLSLYSKHFFGVYAKSSGHGHRPYAHAGAIWFLGSLLKPTASPDNLKGGPVLLALFLYLLIPGKSSVLNKAWFLLASFVFAACTATYYLNYYGGGQWYYIPFLLILWFFLSTNYAAMTTSRLAALGAITTLFLCVNINTVVTPSLLRLSTLGQARDFMNTLRSLESTNSMLSEDTFFFRKSYKGELIDMGDMVSRVRKSGYYGVDFSKTVDSHFEQSRKHPPDYIVTGFTESPELKELIEKDYILIEQGPGNFTANGHGESRLFMRKDLHALQSNPRL